MDDFIHRADEISRRTTHVTPRIRRARDASHRVV